MNKLKGTATTITMAALAFLQAGGNQAALDKVAPHKTHSPRQRQKIVTSAHTNLSLHSEQQKIINSMTNWQRNQWGRAGSPMDIEILKGYAEMAKS